MEQAIADPRFYEAAGIVLWDRSKWMRWSVAGLQSESYQPFAKPFDPEVQLRWKDPIQSPANWIALIDPVKPSSLAQPAK